jgi:hypothetical protein
MARAKVKGTKSGKAIGRPAIIPAIRTAIRNTYMNGGIGMRAAGEQFGVSAETVRRCMVES